MGSKSDLTKRRAKQAVGSLTGDKALKSDRRADSRTGEAKETVKQSKDMIERVIDKAEEKVEQVIDKAKDALHRK